MTTGDPPRHIFAVTRLIRNFDTQVLMLLSPKRGWRCPGGQVENGEALPESTAVQWVESGDVLARIEHPAIHGRVRDMLSFDGRVIYQVYTSDPYQVLTERYLVERI